MDRDHTTLIRHREVRFCRLNPGAAHAHDASLMLSGVEGIHHVQPVESHLLHVRYDITIISLKSIDDVLIELGFHLDNTLLYKLKRALYYYSEETQQANMGQEGGCCAGKQLFIDHYHRRSHGCRDPRPEHWRNYR
jgi:hypothetical protein